MADLPVTIKQLQYLLAIGELRHFRKAAERCGISQPSLSVQLSNLEESLGIKLVERSRSGVALTPIGREVADRARRVIDESRSIVDLAKDAKHGLSGTIRLGSKPTLGPYLLPHVVATLHKQHKDLRLYVRENSPRELEHELTAGIHDLILAQSPVESTEHVTFELFREPLYLALASDHPLAQQAKEKKALPVAALKGLDMLSLNPLYYLNDQVNALCQEHGAHLLKDYEGTSLDALRLMVGMGMGAAFLPALYVHSEIKARSEIVVIPLKGRRIYRTICLAWRKSAGRARAYNELGHVIRNVVRRKFDDLVVPE
ncbi:hydrogen peroxide-inducible genes activator [Hyphococcus lacteus]|uniref:Hydrogen peroxide-inducible genes activator n=1 Tax=Hyphococcus lacteus TaxID=3143536 RepID=A0ABV3Z766_9PROT